MNINLPIEAWIGILYLIVGLFWSGVFYGTHKSLQAYATKKYYRNTGRIETWYEQLFFCVVLVPLWPFLLYCIIKYGWR